MRPTYSFSSGEYVIHGVKMERSSQNFFNLDSNNATTMFSPEVPNSLYGDRISSASLFALSMSGVYISRPLLCNKIVAHIIDETLTPIKMERFLHIRAFRWSLARYAIWLYSFPFSSTARFAASSFLAPDYYLRARGVMLQSD